MGENKRTIEPEKIERMTDLEQQAIIMARVITNVKELNEQYLDLVKIIEEQQKAINELKIQKEENNKGGYVKNIANILETLNPKSSYKKSIYNMPYDDFRNRIELIITSAEFNPEGIIEDIKSLYKEIY